MRMQDPPFLYFCREKHDARTWLGICVDGTCVILSQCSVIASTWCLYSKSLLVKIVTRLMCLKEQKVVCKGCYVQPFYVGVIALFITAVILDARKLTLIQIFRVAISSTERQECESFTTMIHMWISRFEKIY